MMWTLKTGWHVKCVHSGYILSAYPPIIHTLYHIQTFIGGGGGGGGGSVTLTVGNMICESPLMGQFLQPKTDFEHART